MRPTADVIVTASTPIHFGMNRLDMSSHVDFPYFCHLASVYDYATVTRVFATPNSKLIHDGSVNFKVYLMGGDLWKVIFGLDYKREESL